MVKVFPNEGWESQAGLKYFQLFLPGLARPMLSALGFSREAPGHPTGHPVPRAPRCGAAFTALSVSASPLTGRAGSWPLRRFLHCSPVTPGHGAAPAAPPVGSPGRSRGQAGGAASRGSCQRLRAADRWLSLPSVPAENPAASLVIGREDFQRIKEAARVLTKEEREVKLAALKAEKEAVLVGIAPPAPSFPAC